MANVVIAPENVFTGTHNVAQNDTIAMMMETGRFAMTKAERMLPPKGIWHIEWKTPTCAKENLTVKLVRVYDWVCLPLSLANGTFEHGCLDLSR